MLAVVEEDKVEIPIDIQLLVLVEQEVEELVVL
jgi:hypothetical protein